MAHYGRPALPLVVVSTNGSVTDVIQLCVVALTRCVFGMTCTLGQQERVSLMSVKLLLSTLHRHREVHLKGTQIERRKKSCSSFFLWRTMVVFPKYYVTNDYPRRTLAARMADRGGKRRGIGF